MERGAWRATVRGVTKSWTQLERLTFHLFSRCQALSATGVRDQLRFAPVLWIRVQNLHSPDEVETPRGSVPCPSSHS